MRSLKLQDVYRFLVAAIIFLIPSNLFFKLFEHTAYVHGIFVDYLIPKIYISDIPILVLLALWAIEVMKKKKTFDVLNVKKYWWLAILILMLFVRQFFTNYPLASLWYFLKVVELILLTGWFIHHKSIFTQRFLSIGLGATIVFQSLLGIYQYVVQHSLIGYSFLGEAQLTHWAGIAKVTINGAEKILPYGTTAHPNVLGGVITIYLLLILSMMKKKSIASFIVIGLGLTTLYLTYSISAWLSFGLGIYMLYAPSKLTYHPRNLVRIFVLLVAIPFIIHFLAVHNPDNLSLTRRDWLNQAAITMWIDHPLIGVGLNNSTANVEQYAQGREVVRFLQPVHHVGLLWLAETGFLGFSLIVLVLYRLRRNQSVIQWLIILLPILTLDHYLLSQQTGLLLLAMVSSQPKVTRSFS